MTLPTHGRYDYSSITTRPDYTWPNGARLAVYVAVNIEAFGFGVGKGVAIAPPDQAMSASVYSWRDYGNRVGVWRLFDLFDELDLPVEAQMNVEVYQAAPDIPERLRKRGDEIVAHGVTNSEGQEHMREDQENDMIARVTATIEKHEGRRPIGWMSPWLSNSPVTLDLLQEAGYHYTMDWTMDDQPVWLRTRGGRLLSMPYPIEVNDTRGIVWYKQLRARVCRHDRGSVRRAPAPVGAPAARVPDLAAPVRGGPAVSPAAAAARAGARRPSPRSHLARAPRRDLRPRRAPAARCRPRKRVRGGLAIERATVEKGKG